MSEISNAKNVFEKQIQALYTNDFESFLSLMTPRIQKELSLEMFQNAIELYKKVPIDGEAIDTEKSVFLYESEIIPEPHVKLVLVGSGRTLCHLIKIDEQWRIDDIYWGNRKNQETILEEEDQVEKETINLGESSEVEELEQVHEDEAEDELDE
jgi:hypothetical protein